MSVSISQQFRGRTVLLSGALGFVGSTCLEQLLRLTEVGRVLLLVRGKGKLTAQQRVEKLLSSHLFHLLHKQAEHDRTGQANVFSKVQIIEGDLCYPDLGVTNPADRQLLSEAEIVLHSAANLALDEHIQRTLRSNYCGTRQLLDAASQMPFLRSFVFVSTYYVNSFKPYNSSVLEEVHYPPLQLAGSKHMLSHADLVDVLMSLPADTAAAEASVIMSRLNMPSTYAFGKLLTEQLVDSASALPAHVSKAIVRPSLVHSMAGAPCPGYCSSRDGVPGFMLAYAAGFLHDINGCAHSSDALCDVIPVDSVSALIIAAAAAGAATARAAATPRSSGSSGTSEGTTATNSSSNSSSNSAHVYHATSADRHTLDIPEIYAHCKRFWTANPSPMTLPFARLPAFEGRHIPSTKGLQRSHSMTGLKVWSQALLLQLAGRKRQARRLRTIFKAYCTLASPTYARSFISLVDNAHTLQSTLCPTEAAAWPCIVWDKDTSMDWETYLYTSMVGLHTTAFKVPSSAVTTPVPHLYVEHKGLSDASVMNTWLAAAATAAASSSSSTAADTAASPAATAAVADAATAKACAGAGCSSTPLVCGGSKAAAAAAAAPASVSDGSVDGSAQDDRWYLDVGIDVSADSANQLVAKDAISTGATTVADQVASN